MVDVVEINEETPEFRSSTIAQPSSSVKKRRMRQEDAKRIAKDKVFTSYTRRSRRIKGKTLQEDDDLQPEQDVQSEQDVQPEQDIDIQEMEIEGNKEEEKEPTPLNRKQKELEKQIQGLKEELMESEVL